MEKEQMKTVALIASFNRDLILRDCVSCLQSQVDDIVLVGSSEWCDSSQGSDVEKKVAKDMDLLYVDHTNKILGKKWQAGLNKCRELNPDAVLICGSDDLLNYNYVKNYNKYFDSDTKLLSGINEWMVFNPLLDEMIRCKYLFANRSDPIGAGRIILKEALDRSDWQVFPTEGGVGCDLYCYRMLKVQEWSYIPSSLLSVKGDWSMLDSWEQMLNANSLTIDFVYSTSAKNHLNKFFPNIDFDKYRRKHGS